MVSQINTKVSCDMVGCKNKAVYAVPLKGRGSALYLCAECLDKLGRAFNAVRVPKSPKNTIRKAMENREEL